MIVVDKKYCMSSFLMFRCIADKNKTFTEGIIPKRFEPDKNRLPIKTSNDIDQAISHILSGKVDEKTGIMLSGGIDSAILATYMPAGTKAYTLKCIAPGAIDETVKAKEFADTCNLEHKIVEVKWEDYLELSPLLMKHKGAPIHSIEPQIYKAALQAKEDGLEKLVFGESADAIFGGLDGLLSKDWLFDDFVNRYSYVQPQIVLKQPMLILDPFRRFQVGEYLDAYKFISEFFYLESVSSYTNACSLAGIEFVAPYVKMKLDIPLNLNRIRSGDSKYLIRELFKELFPSHVMAPKTPMPRPMSQWLANWEGPKREEFIPNSIRDLTGDQKWLVYVLEWFLNLLEEWNAD